MKSLKAAAVVAGSVVLAGVAAPAFAADTADLTPTSLNGAVDMMTKRGLTTRDVMPLQSQSNALDTENKGSLLHSANGTANALNQHAKLLGGLPLNG